MTLRNQCDCMFIIFNKLHSSRAHILLCLGVWINEVLLHFCRAFVPPVPGISDQIRYYGFVQLVFTSQV